MIFFFFVGAAFIASVLFVVVEDAAFDRTSTLKARLSEALFVYIQNPVIFVLFLVRAFFLLSDGRITAIGIQFLYLPCVVFIGKLCIEVAFRNETIQNWHTIYVSDTEQIKSYWAKELMLLTYAFRVLYGAIFFYGCFELYFLVESVSKDFIECQQMFERSQETLDRVGNLWFSLQAFFATTMCQLTAQVMVVHMLPEIQGPGMQTCRYCVTAAGSIVLVCVGSGLATCDLPAFQPNEPTLVNETFRSMRGLPLYESPLGMYIFQNIKYLVVSGEIDLALITDPVTGRISDELMCMHMRTTYKDLIVEKCSPGFSAKYASPENVLTKACKELCTDFTQWVKKKFSFGMTKGKITVEKN